MNKIHIEPTREELLTLTELDNQELSTFQQMINSSMLKMRIMGYSALNDMYREIWRVMISIQAEIELRVITSQVRLTYGRSRVHSQGSYLR